MAEQWITHILTHNHSLFNEGDRGRLTSAVRRGIQANRQLLEMAIAVFVPTLIKIIIIVGTISYLAGSAMLLVIIPCSLGALWLQWHLLCWRRSAIHRLNHTEDEWYDSLTELFSAVKSIKLAQAESTATKRLRQSHTAYQHQSNHISWVSGVLEAAQLLCHYLTIAMVFGCGALFLTHNHLSTSDVVVLFLLSLYLLSTLMNLFTSIKSYDECRVDKIALEQLLTHSRANTNPNYIETHLLRPWDITIHPFSQSFKSSSGAEVIITGAAKIHLPFGSKVAVIGASGQGKTLFLEALCGIRATTQNPFFIGEHDLHQMSWPAIREIVFYGEHRTSFLSGNFQRSVLFNQQITNHEQITRWMEQLGLDPVVDKTHWDHEELSDGEKKRLSILRALVWNRPITLLDEPTESLDYELRSRVWRLLWEAFKPNTVICITHHLSDLSDFNFDMVLKLEGHKLTVAQASR